MPSSIQIHPPNSNDPSLSPEAVPYQSLLGSWQVVASTLPLWRDKKNVTITYSALPSQPQTTFDDLVSYNKRSDPVGKAVSTVRGVDRLEGGGGNGARWKWRGKGWLMVATSHWQLLGYRLLPPSSLAASASAPPSSPEFVVTFFSSSIFSPAGIDLYQRKGSIPLSDEFVEGVVEKLNEVQELKEVMQKGEGMFRIPHDPEPLERKKSRVM
ncbi:hypothetical protein BCR35DRAFT_351469 [Leucosporidium creatinivorum]|uniref:Uncharacterized protein n=1 Tax=Leucosporidium creatinivorum TaxID=106004 RepID=A0A1Y2FSZ9_9BASI|nr:hypothetical protein BCR35DRAFT_351469 [Leucosporidium creatinivorum]